MALTANEVDYGRRTEFNLLNTQQKLNEFNLRRYKYTILPSLSLFANGGYNTAADEFKYVFKDKYYPSAMVGVQLNVPIFGGGMRLNLIREAKLNIEKTQNNIDNIKQTIDFQSEQAKTTLKNDMLQLESQKRNLELARSVLDLAQKKYKAGVGSNLEVNQAQTDLLQAQNNYFSSLLDVANAQADLKKALGLLK
jgi:outer membrane protein TolC